MSEVDLEGPPQPPRLIVGKTKKLQKEEKPVGQARQNRLLHSTPM